MPFLFGSLLVTLFFIGLIIRTFKEKLYLEAFGLVGVTTWFIGFVLTWVGFITR